MRKRSKLEHFLRLKIRNYFLTGLLVVGPLGLTVLVVHWLITGLDRVLHGLLPERFALVNLFGFQIPGLGLAAGLLLILMVGILTAGFFGKALWGLSESIMLHIPLVKSIYTLFKQVADTMLGNDRRGFQKVVLIEYPRKGLWSIGFVMGTAEGEVQELTEQRMVNVFVPTTPNPTSGYYILVPEQDATVLNMTVEEAFRLIVSSGMVPPERWRGKVQADETGEKDLHLSQ